MQDYRKLAGAYVPDSEAFYSAAAWEDAPDAEPSSDRFAEEHLQDHADDVADGAVAVEGAEGGVSPDVGFAADLMNAEPTASDIAYDPTNHLGGCCCAGCGGMNPEDMTHSDVVANDTGDALTGDAVSAPSSLSDMADFLTDTFWTQYGTVSRKFNLTDSGVNAKSGVLHYNVSGFTNAGGAGSDADGISAARADLVRDVLDVFSEVLGITFVETTSSDTNFTDLFFKDTDAGRAYANSAGYSSGIQYSYINIGEDWSGGTSTYNDYTLQTIFHEVGHALGLGHQGLYNGSGSYSTDADFENDSWQATMMSYFSQTANTSINASRAYLQTPMAVDWIALDNIYGDQSFGGVDFGVNNAFTGDTVYGFNTNISAGTSQIWAEFASYANRTASTIVDSGGVDTLDFSGYSATQLINLSVTDRNDTAASTSNIGGLIGNLTLGEGTVIENAIGGSGADTFIGNEADNILRGNGGNDTFEDSAGSDTYYGGAGTDTVNFAGLFSSYNFEISGSFLSVFQSAASTVVDLVEDTVEWLSFAGDLFSFDELAVPDVPLPLASITAVVDDQGLITGEVSSGGATDDASPTLAGVIDAALSAGQAVQVLRDGQFIGEAAVDGLTWSFTDANLTGGQYSYAVRVIEGSEIGDLSPAFTISVDRAAPSISVDALVTEDATPALSGQVDDPDAAVVVRIDGADYAATNNGDGSWTLADDVVAALAAGTYDVQATAVDAVGNARSTVAAEALTITAPPPPPEPEPEPSDNAFDFAAAVIDDFRPGNQDFGGHSVSPDGAALIQESQSWQMIEGDFVITADTRLSFDFSADVRGEIHGIMFTNGDAISGSTAIRVFGSQNWGFEVVDVYALSDGVKTYDIAIGELFTGAFDRIVFLTDDDANVGADSTWANVVLWEPSADPDPAPVPDVPLPLASITAVVDDQGSITGEVSSGGATDDASPTLAGVIDAALSAGQAVQVLRDGQFIGEAAVDGLTWSFTDANLTGGQYSYAVRVIEGSEIGDLSPAFTISVDRAAPSISVDALVTEDATPALSGQVDDPDAAVVVRIDGADYAATNNGDGSWTLADDVVAALAAGTYDVQATAVDAVGNARSTVAAEALTITAPPPPPEPEPEPSDNAFDFAAAVIDDFRPGNQDFGGHSVSPDGAALIQESQSWQMIEGDFVITADTRLSFDFSADVRGEIHGIMFTNGDAISGSTAIRVFGSQNWGFEVVDVYALSDGVKTYDIAIGELFTGAFDRIVFLTDDDANVGADSTWKNVDLF